MLKPSLAFLLVNSVSFMAPPMSDAVRREDPGSASPEMESGDLPSSPGTDGPPAPLPDTQEVREPDGPPPEPVEQLSEQLQRLSERVAELEDELARRNAPNPVPPEEATGDEVPPPRSEESPAPPHVAPERENPLDRLDEPEFPKSTPLFGSKFRFGFGGYVKVDAIYDFSGNTNRTQFILSGIPIEGSPASENGGYFNLIANESRFNFDLRYVGRSVPFNQAFIELDFFGTTASGTTIPRLRHAYLRWGGLLVGQTWTVLTDLNALAFMIDFAYGDALLGGRSPQVRWEQGIGEHFTYRIGVEMPESGGIENPLGITGTDQVMLPRLSGRVAVEGNPGVVSVGGGVSQLRWNGQGQADNASTVAWVALVTSRVYLTKKKSGYLAAHGSVGQGSGQMIIAFAGEQPDATLVEEGRLETMLSYNASLGWGQRWAKPVSTNLSAAYARLEPTELRSQDRMRAGWIGHVNVIWHIHQPVQAGIEYMVGQRSILSGDRGLGQRLQAMMMYSF